MAYEEYINIMAENCLHILEDMSNIKIVGYSVEKLALPYETSRFKTAIVIPFENKDNLLEGRFVLGIDDEKMAVLIASTIADNVGMPAVESLDDVAIDILAEFMNTMAGMVITEWDKMGLTADFSAPKFKTNFKFEPSAQSDILIHAVSMHLPEAKKLTILTTIEEINTNPLKNKKVLVVDDSKMIRHLLTNEFKNQGCQVSEAQNGLEGVIRTKAFEPDLIIMDLVMPKMNGLEAIGQIREIAPLVHIVVLTSSAKKDEVITAAEYKIKGYIRKPIKMERILKLAQSCFKTP